MPLPLSIEADFSVAQVRAEHSFAPCRLVSEAGFRIVKRLRSKRLKRSIGNRIEARAARERSRFLHREAINQKPHDMDFQKGSSED
ncbi:MAG: hypothetical protein PGN34_05010 [Methylobacterium frigidaeris]